MQALDELVARWRSNPDPEATLALCAHLGTSRHTDLIHEVAHTAEAWHRDNGSVMVSVGCMYLDAGLLAEAQSALVQAGAANPDSHEAYRYLGEVLLRRGDALRAEKALARALELGDASDDTRLWRERALIFTALQRRKGASAVADEIARTAPLEAASSPTRAEPLRAPEPPPFPARTQRRSRPPLAAARPSRPRRSSPPAAPGRRTRSTGTTPEAADVAKAAPLDTPLMGRSPPPVAPLAPPAHPPSPFRQALSPAPGTRAPRSTREVDGSKATPASAPIPVPLAAETAEPPLPLAVETAEPPLPLAVAAAEPSPLAAAAEPSVPLAAPASRAASGPRSAQAPRSAPISRSPAARSAPSPRSASNAPTAAAPPAPTAADVSQPPETSSTVARPPSSGTSRGVALADSSAAPSTPAPDASAPTPETVLLALARVGLYEHGNSVDPTWEAAPRTQRRPWVLGGALLCAVALGIAGHRYARSAASERLALAQQLSTQLSDRLSTASPAALRASEPDLERLFELDTRGQDAARLWLRNRALHALLSDEPVSGLEAALQRARGLGMEEAELVFGRVASAVAAGDLAGAAQLAAQWDQRAAGDGWYQLFVGAALERAGNPDALERLTRAASLDPELDLAHAMAARLALLTFGPTGAKVTLERAYARLGSTAVAARVLKELEWASTVEATAAAPAELSPEELRDLPPFLRGAHAAAEAVRAVRAGRNDAAGASYRDALRGASPALAAWVGGRALADGHVEIARAAALATPPHLATEPAIASLRIRLALTEGQLGAARGALTALSPTSPEATLVEVVSAYENLQPENAAKLLAPLTSAPQSLELQALSSGERVLRGRGKRDADTLTRWHAGGVLWGTWVAVDAALDTGQLELAEQLLRPSASRRELTVVASRLARSLRYKGQSAAALELVPALLHPAESTARSTIEAVLLLVEAGRTAAARSSLEQAADRVGPALPWLLALVEAQSGLAGRAAQSLAPLPLPDRDAPAIVRAVAARALVAVKDRRAKTYLRELEQRLSKHPEVALAATGARDRR